ncbi:MAG: prolyl oligopeptidase family serine peptidase [Woeseia sp.]
MRVIFRDATVMAMGFLAFPGGAGADSIIPESRRVNVVDEIHGTRVPDPYRWLEHLESPEVQSWSSAQNGLAESFVQNGVEHTYRRLLSYSNFLTTRTFQRRGGNTFYLQGWAGSPHAGLYVEEGSSPPRHLAGMDMSSRNIEQAGEDVAGYWPSPDGSKVLVLLRARNQRWGRLDLMEVSTGRILHSASNVYSGFTSAAWRPDGSSYVFAAYARDGEAPVNGRLIRRELASGTERTLTLPDGRQDDRRLLVPRYANDSNRLFVEVVSGSSGTNAVYVIEPGRTEAVQLFGASANWLFVGARGNDAWFYTNEGAPYGRIVRIRDLPGRQRIETVIEEGSGSISAASQVGGNAYGLFGDRIVLLYLENATPILRIFDLEGRRTAELEIPPTGSIWGGLEGDPRQPEVYYQFLGVAEPSSIHWVNLTTGDRQLVAAADAPIGRDDIVATRIFVDRGDGVRVPALVAHRRGLTFGTPRPTILYGYGAFGWVSFLWYQPHVVDWLLRNDGVFVVAGVRGGGEFGTAWRDAGRGQNRQSAIDDYLAVAEHLIAQGITTPDLLVANGGSASGSLAAAAVNQRPEAFGAMILDYPALDLVRYPRFGAARYWADEFGSPDDPSQFRTLLSISPYHNVREGVCYPATLVRTGEFDPTVTPVHGFKFAARLQNATRCDRPVLLDIMEGASHDYGATPEQVARSHAVMLEFLRRTLPAQAPGEANRAHSR